MRRQQTDWSSVGRPSPKVGPPADTMGSWAPGCARSTRCR